LSRPTLRRYWLITAGLLAFFLALFGVVEALGVPLLSDPSAWLGRGGPLAAALGVGLLVADVFLPVPSSLVMIAHGALFGVVWGTVLSLVGSVGAAALGFFVGRRSERLVERLVSPAEKARADELLQRYGALAIVVTRPIPLLAETTAILAGASPLGWVRLLGASFAGSLPPSLLYALTGATSKSFASGMLIFVLVVGVAGALWLFGRRSQRRSSTT
jgi:3-dehydroquinate synthase